MKPLKPFGVQLDAKQGTRLGGLDRASLLFLLRQHKLVLVRGLAPASREELISFAATRPDRDLIQWSFGPVMEMKADPKAENYLFSREAVPFHWDGAFHEEPRTLVFQCVQAPAPEAGGETLFASAESIWDEASPATQHAWKKVFLEYETEKKAHYGGRIRVPLVRPHPDKNRPLVRFAEEVETELNPVRLRAENAPLKLLAELRAALYHPRHCYTHRWQEGDLLLADNFSLLHGRRAFLAASPRHLRRVQLR